MDWGLVVGVIVFVECLVILKGLIELSRQIEDGLSDLDGSLAEAITSVVQNLGGVEPPNPIQNALAQILVNSVNPIQDPGSKGVIDVLQGDDGKFVKKNE